MSFIPSPRSILSAFDQVESDLSDFVARVPLVSEHLTVWSPSLVRCIFDACSQLDSLWKLRAGTASNITIKQHFASHGARCANEWVVLWEGDGLEVHPFACWAHGQYAPLDWWQAYNKLKHNRWENVREATLRNAVDATAALFVALAHDEACGAVLAERKWLHSQYATEYLLSKLYSQPREVPGVTVESPLLSYAFGCSHPELQRRLAYYLGCTRRFGKWLEAKYQRSFMIT